LGKLSLWSTCAGVQEGLAAASCGPWRCRGAEKALGVVRLLYSNTLSVRLCRLGPTSPGCAFRRLLGGKGGQFEGLTRGPGSPQTPSGRGGVCLLASRPVRNPVRGVVSSAAPAGQRQGAPEPCWLGVYLLMPGPWLVPKAGREPRIGSRLSLIGCLRLGRAPEP
jgi:hypothetical protein